MELGIISATGLTTNITIRGLRELSKRCATSQEKAIFNSLKEEDKIRMLNELDEVEKEQFNNIKEQYKQDLKTITNYTDEQINKGMEFHDKMFLYGFNYFNNDNLSINEWNKEYGFKILESVKGELKGGKELNQAINRNIDLEQEVNVLDISKSIEGKITKEKVKQKIQELIDKKEPIKTLSDPYMMELLNKKRSHIINGSRYGKLTPKEFKARNNQLLNVDTLIKNSVLIEKVENTKKDKKPDVDNYYYFYTPIKDGNNTYIVKLVAENSKRENIVNLYDLLTEKELKVNDKGTKSLLGPSQARMETNNSSTLTIKQILSNVKDINGKNALESYMEENGLNQPSTFNSQLPTPNNSSLSTLNSQLSTPLGQYDITNRIMYLSKQSNITTFQHEMMHWWRQTVKTFADVGNKQAQIDMNTLNNYVGATTDSDWTREQEEVFARAWEQYLRRGIAPNKQLQSTFDKIREWFIEIYKTAKDIMYNGKPIELNKNIIEYFDKLMNLDTIKQQDIETNYNIQYDKLKNKIDEARNILYQEEPDFTEEEINAILRERFKEQLTPLEELQYRIEQENKKTLKQKVNEIFNTYQYDKQEFKDLVNRVKTEIKDISKTIKKLKNGDVKIAEIDNQDLSIEDIIELRNIANKRLPRRPMTLMDFVKRKGGIWEGDKYGVGELQRIKGLVHKNPYMKVRDSQSGKINFIKRATVDDLRRASEEAGFLNRHSEVDDYDSQITLNDFLNALSDEESGTYYYRPEDRNKVLEYESLKEQQNQAGAILQKLEQDLNLDIDNILDIYNKAKENNFKIIDKDRIKLIQEESKKAQNDIKNIIKEIQSKEQTVKQELNAELKEKINTIKEDLKNKALEEQQELKTEYKDKLNTIKQANKILTTDLKQGFKNKIKTIKAIQSKVIEMINQTNLDNENKAKFLSTIKNIQTEEDYKFINVLTEEFNDERNYNILNKYYIEHYNKDLKRVAGIYIPSKSEYQQEIDFFNTFISDNVNAFSTLKERKQSENIKPIPQNLYNNYVRHIKQIEYIDNVAPVYKEIERYFINDNKNKNDIIYKFGNDIFNTLKAQLNSLSFIQIQQTSSDFEKIANQTFSNWVVAKIASPVVFFKQSTGIFSYMENVNSIDFTKNLIAGLTSPKQTIDFMLANSDMIHTRFKNGFNDAIASALEYSKLAIAKNDLNNWFTYLTRLGDAGAVIFGGYAQVKTEIENGISKEQAFKNFEIQTIRTQQSGLTSSLSLMQQNSKNVFVRMYLAFKNQNLQFLRKIYDSIIMYQNGDITKKELAKTLTLYILIQPKIYTLISAAGYKLFRDRSKDDDNEDDTTIIGDIFQNIIKAPIDGIPIITDIYDFVANKVRGKKNYKVFSTPMLDDITTAMKKLNKNDITIKDYLYFIASFGEVTTGIPFHNINKLQRMFTKEDLLRN